MSGKRPDTAMRTEERTCQNCKIRFTINPEDFDFYKKIAVPPPTFCPECRMKRRFAWRNEHNLYKRKDDRTGQEIFAGFPPAAAVKVYEKEYWISDAWDALQYGREYDFSRSFFDQFKKFAYEVPWPSRSILNIVNSDYSDQAGNIKNCYLCFSIDHAEDSAYIVRALEIRNCFDLAQVTNDELCYEGISISGCYRTFFSDNCDSCNNVWFSRDCIGCNDCFGCANLRNASYHFFNEKLSKGEYEKRFKTLRLDSWKALGEVGKKAKRHLVSFPVKYFHGVRAIDSTGEYLRNTKNVKHSWFVEDGQDVKYSQNLYFAPKDSYDYTVWGNGASLIYECLTCGEEINNLKFCFDCWPACRDLEYCISCRSSSNLFGCVGLQKKQYCIFNKQYTKETFFELRGKIVKHMNEMPYKNTKGHVYSYGEFFPEEFSPFAYNETMMGDIYPLTKEAVIAKGYEWRDPEVREYQTTMNAADLPDSILDVSEEISKQLIQCTSCKRAYRIVPSELAFLKQMQIPLPRECSNCRLTARLARINKPVYYHRRCQCVSNSSSHLHSANLCPNEFETSYALNRPEIVYCERCYQAEVI